MTTEPHIPFGTPGCDRWIYMSRKQEEILKAKEAELETAEEDK